ncbi:hypothetical protein Lyticum_00697 [Lyticum sinuosum]|uniref:Uncharacterized protein n=1 Tax=Lyticum sinuosum TaxID=1332059 RepID=A0AAE4VK85_9RICK|nr:hypothetical protein [Lyticum sinuosum]
MLLINKTSDIIFKYPIKSDEIKNFLLYLINSKNSLKSLYIDELNDISKIMLLIKKTSDIIFKYPIKSDEIKNFLYI